MASTYLSRTSGTPTSQKIGTFSLWIKRSELVGAGNEQWFSSSNSSTTDLNNRWNIKFTSTEQIELFNVSSSSTNMRLQTNRVFRDVNAWYHIVFTVDTTQATASDRLKMWVNGVQETSFSASTYPSLDDTSCQFFQSGKIHRIGAFDGSGTYPYYLSALITHYHYTDGTAYDASTFGEYSATSGVWKPKTAPSVTYGTNGFFLKFANSAALGTDSSVNGNDFTVNGSGTQTLDNPSNNFATLNALLQSGVGTFTNGNLTHSSSSGVKHTVSTLGITTGKWYAEAKYTGGANYNGVGFATEPIFPTTSAWYASPYSATLTYTNVYNNSSSYGSFAVPNTGDIIGMAIDLDNGYMYWSNNGVWGNSGVPTSGATGTGGIATSLIGTLGSSTFFFATEQDATPGTRTAEWNFGNGYFGTTAVSTPESDGDGFGKFEYAVPTGYYSLCTKNIITYG